MIIENISANPLLKDISLQLPSSGLVAIIGPNGAGKTTFLKVLAGLISPQAGSAYYQKTELTRLRAIERANYISYLPQQPIIYWDITVKRLIMLGLIQHRLSFAEEEARIESVAEKLQLTDFLQKPVRHLSGGEIARVHLARVLIANTPVLLVDEPIAALDPYFQLEIMKTLKKECQDKLGVIVLHDLSMAIRYCDYFVLMQGGKVIVSGTKQQVMTTNYLRRCFSVETTVNFLENQVIIKDISN